MMRDYAELVKSMRCCSKIDARNNGCDSCPYEYCGDDCQNLCGCAADAIEELLAERDKALNRLCELCGVCSEKSRSPMECEIAGFVEPPKEENTHD